MASLYELSAWYANLLEQYDAAETDEERDEIAACLVNAEGDMTAKADAYAKLIRNKTAETEAFRNEAKRLTAKAKAGENLIDRLKNAMLDAMKLTDTPNIQTSIGKWRLQKNPYSCKVTDWTKIPQEFREPQPDKVDNAGLIKHFKATGELFDGCEITQNMGVRFQ